MSSFKSIFDINNIITKVTQTRDGKVGYSEKDILDPQKTPGFAITLVLEALFSLLKTVNYPFDNDAYLLLHFYYQ